MTLDRFGKYWEGLGRIGKRAKPAAAGRRAAPASYTLGNAHYPHTIVPMQRPQPPRTMQLRWRQYTPNLPNLPNTSQYFPQKPPSTVLPAYAALRPQPPTYLLNDSDTAGESFRRGGGKICRNTPHRKSPADWRFFPMANWFLSAVFWLPASLTGSHIPRG